MKVIPELFTNIQLTFSTVKQLVLSNLTMSTFKHGIKILNTNDFIFAIKKILGMIQCFSCLKFHIYTSIQTI